MLPLFVVNNHGQFNHLIQRMLRDAGVEVQMIPNTTPLSTVSSGCRGVILGGGPSLSRAGNSAAYLECGLPVLGICLGLHVIAVACGGSVAPGRAGGYGAVEVSITERDRILAGYPDHMKVWASHADEVTAIPPGFSLLATSPVCRYEAIASEKEQLFGLQWHPEVSHTENGVLAYRNFDEITREIAGR